MKTVDLFSGCGGLSLGLQEAGWEVAAAYDAWDVAIHCYRMNFDHEAEVFDLCDTRLAIKTIKQKNVDMIAGGPPCQDFSHAGKRTEGHRASLTGCFAEIVAGVCPQWFLMENVDRARNSVAYAEARSVFKRAGYGLWEGTLDASYCGVPQSRKRFFCIGGLGEADGFLNNQIQSSIAKKPMTVRQFLGGEIDTEFYYRHPRNYCRRGVYSIDEPAPTMRGVNRPIPKGYPGHAGDACPLSSRVRSLTTLERARIQTFPRSFRWIGNKTNIEQMIGNAVPVRLARFVGKALLSYVREGLCVCAGK